MMHLERLFRRGRHIHNALAVAVVGALAISGTVCGGKAPPGNGTPDAGSSADSGPTGGTGTLAIRMWRTDSPQGEVAVGGERSALADLWFRSINRTVRPHEIPGTLRTGKNTPTELKLPAGTHYVALFREGHASSIHRVQVQAGERVEMLGRLPIDLTGVWVNVVPGVGTRNTVTVDSTAPTCNRLGHEAGDACVHGFPPRSMVLQGSRLFLRISDGTRMEGLVLQDGQRVEYENTRVQPPPTLTEQLAYERVQ